jgi:D-alanine-D-alanine ligase
LTAKKLKVLVLFDLPSDPPADGDFSSLMSGPDWKDERDVIRTLKKLGHEVRLFGIFDDVKVLVDELSRNRPDVIFNQCESFNNSRQHEPSVIALLDLLRIPYTGARPEALQLCKDKGLTKKILSYHQIKIPYFEMFYRSRPRKRLDEPGLLPGICKPLGLEASEGISQGSLVNNEADCLDRIKFIHERLDSDAIVEEYIDGRELYVGIFGNERLTVLPPQELFFKQTPDNVPRFLTYKAKWDQNYRKKYGIDSDQALNLSPAFLEKLSENCKQIYRLLKLSGYARIDLRMGTDEEPVFIEANPNPSIHKGDDFAWSARLAGISYDDLINKILNLALAS